MRGVKAFMAVGGFCLLTVQLFAQVLRVDPSFAVEIDGPVYGMELQPDGKILIGGAFTNVNGVTKPMLARLNPDATVDTNFSVTGEMLVNPALKIIFAGQKIYSSLYRGPGIHRYDTNGTYEEEYGIDADFAIDSGGRIVYGRQTEYSIYTRLGRFKPDGTNDDMFRVLVGCCHNEGVNTVTIQNEDGAEKILLGGDFAEVNGIPLFGLARLNPDGSVDPTFKGSSHAPVKIIRWWKDGMFYTATKQELIRRFSDGSVDPNFNAPFGGNLEDFFEIAPYGDGRVLTVGDDCANNGCRALIRQYRADGSLDTNAPFVVDDYVSQVKIQSDNTVLIAGSFQTVNCIRRTSIARLIPSEVPDPICVPPPPPPELRLELTKIRGKMVCCWPTNYPEYTLQATKRLRPNHPEKEKWVTVTNLPVQGESTVCVTNRILRWGRHYRLSK
jgi:uncharacterized delta-60 repeat protein